MQKVGFPSDFRTGGCILVLSTAIHQDQKNSQWILKCELDNEHKQMDILIEKKHQPMFASDLPPCAFIRVQKCHFSRSLRQSNMVIETNDEWMNIDDDDDDGL